MDVAVSVRCTLLQNDQAVVIRELFRLVEESPIKTMILGPFGSSETILVAQTSRWWNLIQVWKSTGLFQHFASIS